MDTEPLVSVIVPIYRVEAYLEECVGSIVGQTYRNMEILLVDDGSPDACPEMVDGWAKRDGRIRAIHKENGGLSSARNAGLEAASGVFVAFIDSDDWVEPAFIEELVRSITAYHADIATAGFSRAGPDGRKTAAALPLETDEDTFQIPYDQAVSYIFGSFVAVWGKLYRRDVVGETRFIQGRMAEDVPFQTEVLRRASGISFCSGHLYNYRQREGSIARTISPAYLADYIRSVSELRAACDTSFPYETEHCEEWLCRLLYEYTAADAFSEAYPDDRAFVMALIEERGGRAALLGRMRMPEEEIIYVFRQFCGLMTPEERRALQAEYRNVFSAPHLTGSGLRRRLKLIGAYISLKITTAVR